MILTRQKSIEELKGMLEGSKNVALLGCGGCVTFYNAGGRKQTIELAERLQKEGVNVVATGMNPRQCYLIKEKEAESLDDVEAVKKFSRSIEGLDEAEDLDAVLSLACGVGAQTIANLVDIPVFPAQDTVFKGRRRPERDFDLERCIGCGNCIIGYTGGICPVTRCAKSIMNGPCGGVFTGGYCEVSQSRVSEHPVPCAWVEIYQKLKRQGRLGNIKETFAEKDFVKATHMRKLEVEK